MRKFIYILLAVLSVSCDKIENTGGGLIGLRARIGEMEIVRKSTASDPGYSIADPFKGTVPTKTNTLNARLLFYNGNTDNTYNLLHQSDVTFDSDAVTYAGYTYPTD
jgi:hypothetical protein